MRYLRYSFYAVLLVVLVMLALANREMVTLAVLPEPHRAAQGFPHKQHAMCSFLALPVDKFRIVVMRVYTFRI